MMLASTSRSILASRSARSRYRLAFSIEIAAWEVSSVRITIRAGVNAAVVRLFSKYSIPINLVCLSIGRESAFFWPKAVVEHRLREICGCDACLFQDHVHVVTTGCGLCFNLIFVAS